MTTQEQIAVMQAYVDGKKIQWSSPVDQQIAWMDTDEPLWNWETCTYRVKPEPILPKTWKEFCETHPIKVGETYIRERSSISSDIHNQVRDPNGDRNVLPNVSTAKAMLALCQLIQLRDCYNQGWQPDWKDNIRKFAITIGSGVPVAIDSWSQSYPLVFQTAELRTAFLTNFCNLIEVAKPLL